MHAPFVLTCDTVAGASREALKSLLIEKTGSAAAATWVMIRLDQIGCSPEIDHFFISAEDLPTPETAAVPELWSVDVVYRGSARARV